MIRIRYGTHGMGHAVRMGRLAKVLRQRGATVDIRAYGTDPEPLDRFLRDNPGGILVLDRPINSDTFLAQVRPNVKKLMVVVGVGHTITRETQWIADAVLYQNTREAYQAIPGANVWNGPGYLLLDPLSPGLRAMAGEKSGVFGYFGAGFPAGYGAAVAQELSRLLPGVSVIRNWNKDPLHLMAKSRLFIGSMGMAVNEAVAVGTSVLCVSIDEEHAEDADTSALKHRVRHLGRLKDISPDMIAAAAAKAYNAPDLLSPINAWDCMGVYRVARWLLE